MASPELLFRGARVIDPRAGRDEVADRRVPVALGPELAHGEIEHLLGIELARPGHALQNR